MLYWKLNVSGTATA